MKNFNEEPKIDMYNTLNRGNSSARQVSKKQNSEEKMQQHLPYIENRGFEKQQRLNQVRNQTQKTRQNIELLKARIHALKKQKEKNAKETMWAKQKIQFITTIKNRIDDDDKKKKQLQSKRQLENIYLKRKASEHKHNHQKNKEMALHYLNYQKYQNSSSIRNEAKQNALERSYFNQSMAIKNKQKANEIKQMKKQMYETRRAHEQQLSQQAKINYKNKIQQELLKKKANYDILHKLSNEQQSLIEELKMSQTSKLTQFKTLSQLLVPEKIKRKSVYSDLFRKVLTNSQKKIDNPEITMSFY